MSFSGKKSLKESHLQVNITFVRKIGGVTGFL